MEVILVTLLQYIRENNQDTTNILIAKCLMNHIYELKHLSLDQMAELCLCSPSTLTRFFRVVGFKNYRLFMTLLSQPQLVYHHEGFNTQDHLDHIKHNLAMVQETLNQAYIDRIVLEIYNSRRVIIYAFPTHQALTLEFQLKMLLTHRMIEVVPLGQLDDLLEELNQDDLLILISFSGQYMNEETLQYLSNHHIRILAITQEKDSLIDQYSNITILCGDTRYYGEENYALLYILDCIYQGYVSMLKGVNI